MRTFQFALLWLGNFETSGCLVGIPICGPATTTLTPQLVGITTTTYNPSPYIGSQTFLWSLVQVSSKLFSFPCTLSAKCVFLGLHHQSVRRVYGTSTLLLKYSFTGLLPTSVLESLWRLISKHLTWVPCGNWTDRRRHSKTLSFFLSSSSFFCYLKCKSNCSKTTRAFFYNQTCNSGLTNELYWDFFCRSDWQT